MLLEDGAIVEQAAYDFVLDASVVRVAFALREVVAFLVGFVAKGLAVAALRWR